MTSVNFDPDGINSFESSHEFRDLKLLRLLRENAALRIRAVEITLEIYALRQEGPEPHRRAKIRAATRGRASA